MRKFILLLFAALLFASVDARTYVMIVGVSAYQDSDNNLKATTNDAKAFRNIIKNQTKNITILTSKNANRANIMEKLRAICNRAQKGDNILFYYAGHGYAGGIFVYDGEIGYETLNDVLESTPASVIGFIDACHSGSVKGNNSTYSSPSGNIIYLMACRAEEYSVESPWIGHGYFTQSLLKGIRGVSDSNKDKKVTVNELFRYIYKDVLSTTAKLKVQQHPQLIGSKKLLNTVVATW